MANAILNFHFDFLTPSLITSSNFAPPVQMFIALADLLQDRGRHLLSLLPAAHAASAAKAQAVLAGY